MTSEARSLLAYPAQAYPAQGIMSLLSYAWNLLKLNLKNSLLIMLGPILLATLLHLLVSIFSSQTFLTPITANTLAMRLAVVLIAILLAIPTFFVWVLSCCALSRLYYSNIINKIPLTPKDCWRYINKVWLLLSLLTILLLLMMILIIALEFLILFLGISLSALIIGALSISVSSLSAIGPGVMMFFFLLLLGFLVLSITIGLSTFQGFFLAFPLIAIATAAIHPIDWQDKFKEAYQLLSRNFPRLIVFALALFCFSAAITTVLVSPIWLWGIWEMARLGISQQHYIPLHVQTIINIGSSLVNLLILPFHVSALTLLWYDCQVRSEGLDLILWLNDLMHRQGKQPSAFGTEFELKPL